MADRPTTEGATTRRGRLPHDPWGRWAFALLLASAAASVLSLLFPWWAWREESGSAVALSTGQWCWTNPGAGTRCWPYTGATTGFTLPAGLVSSLSLLAVLQIVAVIAFAMAFLTFALPQVRARALKVPALAGVLGIVFAWAAVVYAWFSIPGTGPNPWGSPSSGFTGEQGAMGGGSYFGWAWGAGNAWFLLLLAAGTGMLALFALRAAVRSVRPSLARASNAG